MTTKPSGSIAATRQKILAQISIAQKQADAAKKAAKKAKAGFKQVKQKFKEAKRSAKIAKKTVRALKSALAATAAAKPKPKPAIHKSAAKRPRAGTAPTVAREPVVTISSSSDSVPPIVSLV